MLGSREMHLCCCSHETEPILFKVIGCLLSEVLRKVWHVCAELHCLAVFI